MNSSRTTPANKSAIRRALSGAAVVTMVAAGATVLPTAGAQAKVTTECTGYNFKCDDSGYNKVAHKSLWRMAPGHNCTNYVAHRLIQAGMPKKIAWLHNGGDWARDARKHGVPVNDTPAVGSVAQWNSGAGGLSSAGHVAYVIAVTESSITIAEDNYPAGPMAVRTITNNDFGWPSNFIHFTPQPAAEPLVNPAGLDDEWAQFLAEYGQLVGLKPLV